MANSSLKEEMLLMVEKMNKQYQLLEEKISAVDCVEAANNPNLYEKLLPVALI